MEDSDDGSEVSDSTETRQQELLATGGETEDETEDGNRKPQTTSSTGQPSQFHSKTARHEKTNEVSSSRGLSVEESSTSSSHETESCGASLANSLGVPPTPEAPPEDNQSSGDCETIDQRTFRAVIAQDRNIPVESTCKYLSVCASYLMFIHTFKALISRNSRGTIGYSSQLNSNVINATKLICRREIAKVSTLKQEVFPIHKYIVLSLQN